jgi:Uma2 family endonuclease
MATEAVHSLEVDALPLHRLDVETYDRMVASGALEGRRVELLDGLLVEVSPHSPEHARAIQLLTRELSKAHAYVRVQLPLEVQPDSEPEPDLALVAEDCDAMRHPRSALLAVEVAVSSHRLDRGPKARMYAAAGVPTYWLVDLPGRRLEVRTDPCPGGYRRCDTYGLGERVPSPAEGVPDLPVDSLFV